jgi:hypothetical protein
MLAAVIGDVGTIEHRENLYTDAATALNDRKRERERHQQPLSYGARVLHCS